MFILRTVFWSCLLLCLKGCGVDETDNRHKSGFLGEDATHGKEENATQADAFSQDAIVEEDLNQTKEDTKEEVNVDSFEENLSETEGSDITQEVATTEPIVTETKIQSQVDDESPAVPLADQITRELEVNLSSPQSLGLVNAAFLSEANLQLILEGARNGLIDSGLLQSENLLDLLPTILAGAMSSASQLEEFDKAFRKNLVEKIVASIISSIKDRGNFIPPQDLSDPSASPIQVLLKEISQIAIQTLKEAGFDTQNLEEAAQGIMKTIVASAELAGITPEELQEAIRAAMEGAVEGASKIEIDGNSFEDMQRLTEALASGATQGIADLKAKNYKIEDLPTLVEDVANGLQEGLAKIEMDFGGEGQFGEMVTSIVTGVSAELDKLKATNEELKKLGEFISKITSKNEVDPNDLNLEEVVKNASELAEIVKGIFDLFSKK